MNTIEQWHNIAEVREFSTKEVCDIISTILFIDEQNIPDGLSLEDIIRNSCYNEHSDNVITNIAQHIRDLANIIAENREVDC